jgi:hypothetical protein
MLNFAQANEAVLQFITGLGQTAQGLASFGMLTQDLATKISLDMGGAIQQMVDAGLPYQQALALSAQDLFNLKMAAERSGVTLDAHTQKLIDDAEAAGLFETLQDPMEKLVEVQEAMLSVVAALTETLGGEVPAAVQAMIDEFNSAKINVTVNVDTNVPQNTTVNGDGAFRENSFAGGSGGFRDFGAGTAATLHGVEAVMTPHQFSESLRAAEASAAVEGLRADMRNVLPGILNRAVRDGLLKASVS